MLYLPLLRGFGLMVLVAPCYKPSKRPSRQWPTLACPPIDGDLLVDARALYDGGNLVAAAMTARVEVERQLTTLALKYPKFGSGWRGIALTAEWLFKHKVVRENTYIAVMKAADVGNRAAHGQPVTKVEVLDMLGAVQSLRQTVVRKGGAA